MTPVDGRRGGWTWVVCGLSVLGHGCYDDHARMDTGTPLDAGPQPDAGDVGPVPVDAFDPCIIEGRHIEGSDESRPLVQGCRCLADTVPGIALRSPAPLAVEHGSFTVCVPPPYDQIILGLCPLGWLFHRYQDSAEADAAGVDVSVSQRFNAAACLDPSSCLFADSQFPPELQGGCLYPDYTSAVTGLPNSVPCEGLDDGLCAVNCPCTDARVCWGVSEQHAIGICSHPGGVCVERGMCGPNVCVVLADPPAFASEIQALPGGVCAPTTWCEALMSAVPDLWTCPPSGS